MDIDFASRFLFGFSIYYWVRCVSGIIGKTDFEGSKRNIAMDAWLSQASHACGKCSDTSCLELVKSKGFICHIITVCICTKNQN